ncbi:nucleoside triphosphate pyrophosphatase [Porphyrobacter sp. GA68]|uniref:Maf family protein n=1 Tax=Porphyrobacter sp. GA68 TaxID=2883480 RepID=UPI001D18D67F|nr:Maf family protein [Porphyrobacter sp. GA68]
MIWLASKSASRAAMLRAAGVTFEQVAADINERAMEKDMAGAPPDEIVQALAAAKACAARVADGGLVLGSDSLVVVEGRRFDKPESRAMAAEHLAFFSGKIMELHSAAALVRAGKVVHMEHSFARLKVRELSAAFIDTYLHAEWPDVGHCVGVFRIEGRGVQLFDWVAGDHFTILGMPLLPVLAALRAEGELAQ